MATYYLSTNDSDLSGGADFNKKLVRATETVSSITVLVTNAGTDLSYAFTDTGVPSNNNWDTAGITVEVNVTTANAAIYLKVSASRIDREGTVQETSSETAEQNLSAAQVYTFSIPSKDWTIGNCTDRIRLNYYFRSTNSHGGEVSVVIGTGTTDTEHTTSITEFIGACGPQINGLNTSGRGFLQFDSDHSTTLAVGGTTDATKTPFLTFPVSTYYKNQTLTPKVEVEETGTAFDNTATVTENATEYDPDSPANRRSHSLVYDSNRDRMILFGGIDRDGTYYNDTWALQLHDGLMPSLPQWSELSVIGTKPGARNTHAAEYDSTNNRMIISHGYNGADLSDTWILDFSNDADGEWAQMITTGTTPLARAQASSAIKNSTEKMYLTCGWGAARYNDVQELDISMTPWDISTSVYANKSKDLSNEELVPTDVTFSSDGSKMYIVGTNDDTVEQYALSVSWDVSTATVASKTCYVGGEEITPTCLDFSSDGTKMYIIGYTNDTVYQYTLTTAWDVSTASYSTKSFDTSSQNELYPYGLAFSSDGTKMYMNGDTNDTVYQYTLTTAWDVSTASYSTKSFDASTEITNTLGLAFSSDGTKMYILDYVDDTIHQYTLSTAWDMSTTSYANKSYIETQETVPYGITLSNDGTKLYVVGDTNNTVYQYTMSNYGAWTELEADGAAGSPSKRNDPSTIFDITNNRLILFGGNDGTVKENDCWEYDLTTNVFTELTGITGTAPSIRELAPCVYDSSNGRMIIYGGRNGTAASDVRTDLFELDLTDGSEVWTDRSGTAGELPAAVWGNAISAYDSVNELMIVVGGMDSSLEETKHAFVFDLSSGGVINFRQLVFNNNLRNRDAMGYAYDEDLGNMLSFGGYSRLVDGQFTADIYSGEHCNEVWLYNPSANEWFNPINDNEAGPHNREGASAIYDTNRNRFIVFGGLTGNATSNNTFYNDTWELKADAQGHYKWTKLSPTGTKPEARWLHGATYDRTNDRMILFGGDHSGTFDNDTWELDFSGGLDGVWSELTPSGTPPTAKRQMTYIYDETNTQMVICHGGLTINTFTNEIHFLDLTNGSEAWSAPTVSGTAPTARRGMTGVYDNTNGYMIFFGGYDGTNCLNDVGYLDLTSGSEAWTTLSPSTNPETRRSHTAGFDRTNQKMYAYGGRDAADVATSFITRNNTWEFNASDLTPSNWDWAEKNPDISINASVKVTGLTDNTNYHWQCWATGSISGDNSAFTSFGGNVESAADFVTPGVGALTIDIFDNQSNVETIIIANVQLGGINIFDNQSTAEDVIAEIFVETLNANIYDQQSSVEDIVIVNIGLVDIYDEIIISEDITAEKIVIVEDTNINLGKIWGVKII